MKKIGRFSAALAIFLSLTVVSFAGLTQPFSLQPQLAQRVELWGSQTFANYFQAPRTETDFLNPYGLVLTRVQKADPTVGTSYDRAVLDYLSSLARSQTVKPTSIGWNEAQALLCALRAHPVASLEELPFYDSNGLMSFCFGRAMAAQLESVLKRNISNENLLKIWIVGDIFARGKKWNHHVALLVRDNVDDWWVIDPVLSEPVRPVEWYSRFIRSFSYPGRTALFLSSPLRFLANSNEDYAGCADLMKSTDFERVFPGVRWSQYFSDLLRSYGLSHEGLPSLRGQVR